MNKCPLCRQKKGKRFCSALSQSICPTCCGRERLRSLKCDPACPYIERVRERQFLRWLTRVQEVDYELSEKVMHAFPWMLSSFFATLADFHLSFRSLTDEQAGEALHSVIQSLETEAKGILYEPASPNPSVQTLIRALRERIHHIRDQVKNEYSGERYHLEDILDCLRCLDLYRKTIQQEDPDPYHFLDSAVLISDVPPEKNESSPSLIIAP